MTAPRRALIVIDAQQEYFEGLLPIQHPDRDESVARVRSAIDAAAESGAPVVVVQHELPEGTPVFAARSTTWQNHPDIAAVQDHASTRISKRYSSVFAGTGLEDWLREQEIDTITLVGYMTNNCVLASAAAAEPLGIAVEVLSDATGAVDLANDAGSASAQQVHEILMALLQSNWAAVADTETWISALKAGDPLETSDLVTSAAQGRESA
ncbi:isochorismatase family protein [Nesterenkonia sp. HG001]|uniref:isochorismatase family protein n=1 Tax=Nesterenkonia sp. HG001 TaxID=2983207 RepID=UPI002AC4D4C5|nr:isochorismatase family protein [Nesterenkonia sp. HG001]MDZ5078778.1 isochorismatase family protein [Nesterenkonia sp. HG001]